MTLENGVLTVAGEKKVERTKEGKRYYAVERRSGSFRRFIADDVARWGPVITKLGVKLN